MTERDTCRQVCHIKRKKKRKLTHTQSPLPWKEIFKNFEDWSSIIGQSVTFSNRIEIRSWNFFNICPYFPKEIHISLIHISKCSSYYHICSLGNLVVSSPLYNNQWYNFLMKQNLKSYRHHLFWPYFSLRRKQIDDLTPHPCNKETLLGKT